MAINQSRYVDITSGVGAATTVSTRDLIARFFTENPLAPTHTTLEFESASDVGDYFGFSSTEYLRAQFYFGWTSKNITAAQKIAFARWANVATASQIFGKPASYALATFTAISTGDITLTFGGYTHHITGLDLSAAGSLAAVAADVQAAVRAASGAPAAWTGATVTFDATRGCFDLTSGSTGTDTISVTAGVTEDLAIALGWLTGAILSNGASLQSITQLLDASADASNNFGSFAFIPTLSTPQILEAATWNNSLSPNIQFMYSIPVTASNAVAVAAALDGLAGYTMTLAPISTEYPEQVPMMIMAATNYQARNSVQNYMFQIFDLTPSVTTDADANTYDALTVNYYGQTQTAGNFIQFYQRGVMGSTLPVNPADQNVYANEMWFKDASSAAIMTLLLALAQVPANSLGRIQILAILQSVINQALFNGTISVGKPLTTAQQLFITNATGDAKAWQQVQNIGYWIDVQIVSFVESNTTKWKAVYTLIYSKDDVIRKVEGSDVLI